jgi:uncharacterized membrane-anchored protein YhcB (DUF1043 family)
MDKNAIIIVLGIIGLTLFIDKTVVDNRTIKQDITNQYRFDEKQAELDKQHQEIMTLLGEIESEIKTLRN